MLITVREDGRNMCDLGCGGDCFCVGGEEFDDVVDGSLGALVEIHGVVTCHDVLDSLGVNSANGDSGHFVPSTVILVIMRCPERGCK